MELIKAKPVNHLLLLVRERAKAVVALLSNEEQLEEERVKAKAIR